MANKIVGVIVCLLIVSMDIGAGFLGIQAEVAQNKVNHLKLWIFECKEPSHDAFKLGLGAAALLILAHVISNLLGGCLCVCSQDEFNNSSSSKQLSIACLLLSWVILAIGLALLVIGILSNDKSRASCGLTHHHFFSFGGICCFVHALFCVAYYVSATAAREDK